MSPSKLFPKSRPVPAGFSQRRSSFNQKAFPNIIVIGVSQVLKCCYTRLLLVSFHPIPSPTLIPQCTSLPQTTEPSLSQLLARRGLVSRGRIHRHPPLSPTHPLTKRKLIGVSNHFGPNIVLYFVFEAFVWILSRTPGDILASKYKQTHWIPVGPCATKGICRMMIPFVPTQVLCIY
jgi:hypothetical protein